MLIDALLAAAAQHPELFQSYATDLTTHDRAQLAASRAGDEFVWVLRLDGTSMKRVTSNTDPLFITHWISARGLLDYPATPPKTYHIRVTQDHGRAGILTEVSYERARALAEQVPPSDTQPARRVA